MNKQLSKQSSKISNQANNTYLWLCVGHSPRMWALFKNPYNSNSKSKPLAQATREPNGSWQYIIFPYTLFLNQYPIQGNEPSLTEVMKTIAQLENKNAQ